MDGAPVHQDRAHNINNNNNNGSLVHACIQVIWYLDGNGNKLNALTTFTIVESFLLVTMGSPSA